MTGWLNLLLVAALDAGGYAAVLNSEATDAGPGLAAVVIAEEAIVFADARGLADIEADRPLTVDTPLYAGSLSKVFTAVIVLNLVDDGSLSLDASVEFGQPADMRTPFDVGLLLSHASGLPREGNFGYWFSGEFPNDSSLRRYVINQLEQIQPGGKSSYSNIGYAVLGLSAAQVTGKSYSALLQDMLVEPLGLTTTGAPGPAAGIARGYTPENRLIPSEQRPFGGVGAKVGARHLREYHDAGAMTPAFGIYTSAHDLGRVAQYLLNDDDTNLLRRMLEPQASGWGLGLGSDTVEGNRIASHSGWFAAHRSYLMLDAENDIGVVVIANSDDAVPRRVARALYRTALAAASAPASGE